ncbi:MAG: GNAT family N-acetyltransferase [Roseibacillus sp.]
MIRPATSEDGEAVTSLAFRSKAGWGYPEEMMAVFRDELRISGEQLVEQGGHVAEREGAIVGFYTLAPQSAEEVELGYLFVDPGHLRQRIGSALLEHAMSLARSREFKRMTMVSDPHAAEFYEAKGAVVVGEHPTGFAGRVLPILEISL